MSESRPDRHPRQLPPAVAPAVRSGNGPEHSERPRRPGLTPVSLIVSLIITYLLWQIQLLLVLLLLAILLGTLIERPVEILQDRHVPRSLSILLVYVAIIAGLVLFFVGVAPVIQEQSVIFREQAPGQITELQQTWAESSNPILSGVGSEALLRAIQFIDQPPTNISVPEGAATAVFGLVSGIGGGVIGLLTVLVIAFYYLMEKKWLRQLILEQIKPSSRGRIDQIVGNVEAKVGDWMRGQLVLMLVIGVSATIGYGILGIRFWPLLGIWAGLTEIIPIVGPWLGGIPAVIIALTQGWDKALLAIGVIVLLQSMENYILVPRIMRGAVGLTPMTVFLAILAGTQALGIMGAVLAIPIAAAVQVVLSDYFKSRREEFLAEETDTSTGWRWMRGQRVATPGGLTTDLSAPGDGDAAPAKRGTRSSLRRRNWTRSASSRPAKPDVSDE